MNALRSRLSAIARRKSALSKGGTSRLTIRFTLTLPCGSSQTAAGTWLFTSLIKGTVTVPAKVKSYFPAAKAKIAVDRFFAIVYSMPSRYGRPCFQ